MKKIIKLLAIAMVLTLLLFSLYSCGNKIKGMYESESVLGTKTVYEFSGVDEVRRTVIGELGSKTVEGDYEIRDADDGGKTIIFDFDDSDDGDDVAWSFSVGSDYIEIAGVRYNKVG